MLSAVNAEERERLTHVLLDEARRRLPVCGLRKRSTKTLTTRAGVSNGAFYAFFDGREALLADPPAQAAQGAENRPAAQTLPIDLIVCGLFPSSPSNPRKDAS